MSDRFIVDNIGKTFLKLKQETDYKQTEIGEVPRVMEIRIQAEILGWTFPFFCDILNSMGNFGKENR